MGSIDELARRQKVVSWSFVDFIEGLCRFAEALDLPPVDVLEAARQRGAERTDTVFEFDGKLGYWDYYTKFGEKLQSQFWKSTPAGRSVFMDNSDRPLHEQMDALLHLMIAGLCVKWDVKEGGVNSLIPKLKAMAAFLSGGIALG